LDKFQKKFNIGRKFVATFLSILSFTSCYLSFFINQDDQNDLEKLCGLVSVQVTSLVLHLSEIVFITKIDCLKEKEKGYLHFYIGPLKNIA